MTLRERSIRLEKTASSDGDFPASGKKFHCSGSSQHLRIFPPLEKFPEVAVGDAEFQTFPFPAVVSGTDSRPEDINSEDLDKDDLTINLPYVA